MTPRVAIAGAGLMGRWHARAAVRCGAQIAAVFDRDRAAAARLAANAGGGEVAASDDFAGILAQSGAELVHICTPLESHVDLCRRALEAGCHVLVEKPLAPTLAETRDLSTFAGEHRRVIRPAHQLAHQRWLPRVGSIGDILDLSYVTCSAGAVGRDAGGADSVVDEILPHPLSLFDRLLPGCLESASFDSARPRPGELRAQAVAEGVGLSISISMNGRPTRHELRATGTRGTLVADLFHGFAWLEKGHSSRSYKIARPFVASARWGGAAATNLVRRVSQWEAAYPGLTELVAAFYDEIRTGSGGGDRSTDTTLQVAKARDALVTRRAPSWRSA